MNFTHILAAAAIAASFSVSAQQATTDHNAHHPAQAGSAAAAPQSEGEVRKIDLAQGKITLRHGPLANLDMPAMTMVFTAADKKLLEGVKEGDKVRFTADKQNGTFVVTAIQRAE
jgi:Cu(I)/Ag(I) efflux system periplasmic protein CusF